MGKKYEKELVRQLVKLIDDNSGLTYIDCDNCFITIDNGLHYYLGVDGVSFSEMACTTIEEFQEWSEINLKTEINCIKKSIAENKIWRERI